MRLYKLVPAVCYRLITLGCFRLENNPLKLELVKSRAEKHMLRKVKYIKKHIE